MGRSVLSDPLTCPSWDWCRVSEAHGGGRVLAADPLQELVKLFTHVFIKIRFFH